MRRILVVDDDRANVELLTEILAKEGHSIQSATDGETALHRIKAWKPQLMLLDVNLPGVSGLELIPKIRQASIDPRHEVPARVAFGDLLRQAPARFGGDDECVVGPLALEAAAKLSRSGPCAERQLCRLAPPGTKPEGFAS